MGHAGQLALSIKPGPAVPGQLRLWYAHETYPFGDESNRLHREWNRFTGSRLLERGFCPVALDPYMFDDGGGRQDLVAATTTRNILGAAVVT